MILYHMVCDFCSSTCRPTRARSVSRQSPLAFIMNGKLDDGEEIGLELIEGYKVHYLDME